MGKLNQALKDLHVFEKRTIHRQGVNATDLGTGLDYNIFNVEGDVLVHMMFGHVTTLMGAVASTLQIMITTITPAATVALCAASASIAADAVNTLYVWAGTIAGQLVPGNNIGHAGTDLAPWAGNPILLTPGIISIDVAAVGANAEGEIDWYILYTPCFRGANITIL